VNELDIFSAALELHLPEERARYLDEACGDNRELRRRLDELLQAHAHAGSFMGDPAAPRPPAATAEPPRETAGSVIGPYKLPSHCPTTPRCMGKAGQFSAKGG
jgi:hypothetical protein